MGTQMELDDGQSNDAAVRKQVGALEQQRELEPVAAVSQTTPDQRYSFDSMLEATSDLVCILSSGGQVCYLNRALQGVLGLPPETEHSALDTATLYVSWAHEQLLQEGIPAALQYGTWQSESAIQGHMGEIPISQVIVATSLPDGDRCLWIVMREISEYKKLESMLREVEKRYWRIAAKAPGMVYHYIYQKQGANRWLFVSEGCRELFGIEPADLQEQPELFETLIHPDDLASYRSSISDENDELELWRWEGRVILPSGELKWVQGASRPEPQPDDTTVWDGIFLDITQHKLAEERLLQLQEQIIASQRATLIELSTPLLTISEGVMVMPLIGSVDTRRAQQMMETLLHGITTHQAQVVILDITGVPVVDAKVANTFVQVAESAKLVGAKIIITGIRPEVAQTLVGLGIDLSRMMTQSTLQAGITWALQRPWSKAFG